MSHHKTGRSTPSRHHAKGGTLLGVFIGLVIGILISLAVVWYINRTPVPFRASTSAPASGTVIGAEPAALPGKPGDPPPEKRFQFYDILPGKSEPKPEAKAPDKSAITIKSTSPAASATTSTTTSTSNETKSSGLPSLQVGSFQTTKDAENMRATMVLMGVEPSIQPVEVNGKQWFRVLVGPYLSFEELNRVKAELAKSGIQSVVIKTGQ